MGEAHDEEAWASTFVPLNFDARRRKDHASILISTEGGRMTLIHHRLL